MSCGCQNVGHKTLVKCCNEQMSAGTGNCPPGSSVGSDGICYTNCPAGWSPASNGPICVQDCPLGFAPSMSSEKNYGSCIKPAVDREVKPLLNCPLNSDRQYDKCLLDCPIGTHKDYNLCVPDCPPNFVETPDGLSCQAEFTKRTATVREACYANETRIAGRICLAPCETGTLPFADDSELCFATVPPQFQPYFWTGDPKFKANIGPLVAKVIFARSQAPATCLTNFEPINGQCFADCPSNTTAVGTQCLANCPGTFRNTPNQTACIRPTQKRQKVRNIWQNFEGTIKTGVIILGAFLAIALLLNFFNAGRGRSAVSSARNVQSQVQAAKAVRAAAPAPAPAPAPASSSNPLSNTEMRQLLTELYRLRTTRAAV